MRLTLPGAAPFLGGYVASTPLSALWAQAEEAARSAVRHEVLEAWQPLEGRSGLHREQPMVLALAS